MHMIDRLLSYDRAINSDKIFYPAQVENVNIARQASSSVTFSYPRPYISLIFREVTMYFIYKRTLLSCTKMLT